MIYIFEGPDACGKSSQIARLNKYLALKHRFPLNIHCTNFGLPANGKSFSYSEMYYYKLMKDVIKWSDKDIYDVIMDRSWLGENVYGPLYRNKDCSYVFEIEKQLIKPNDVYGFRLITLIDTSLKMIDRDDGQSFSIEKSKKINENEAFVATHEKTLIQDKVLIDIADNDEEETWKAILQLFKLTE